MRHFCVSPQDLFNFNLPIPGVHPRTRASFRLGAIRTPPSSIIRTGYKGTGIGNEVPSRHLFARRRTRASARTERDRKTRPNDADQSASSGRITIVLSRNRIDRSGRSMYRKNFPGRPGLPFTTAGNGVPNRSGTVFPISGDAAPLRLGTRPYSPECWKTAPCLLRLLPSAYSALPSPSAV